MYIIEGKPTPWKRVGKGRNGKPYDTQAKIKEEHRWIIWAQQKERNMTPLSGPLKLIAYYFIEMPPSWSAKKKVSMLNMPHDSIPDSSNYTKYIEDMAEGILYLNDKQIAVTETYKIWSDEPRTVFDIIKLPPTPILFK